KLPGPNLRTFAGSWHSTISSDGALGPASGASAPAAANGTLKAAEAARICTRRENSLTTILLLRRIQGKPESLLRHFKTVVIRTQISYRKRFRAQFYFELKRFLYLKPIRIEACHAL